MSPNKRTILIIMGMILTIFGYAVIGGYLSEKQAYESSQESMMSIAISRELNIMEDILRNIIQTEQLTENAAEELTMAAERIEHSTRQVSHHLEYNENTNSELALANMSELVRFSNELKFRVSNTTLPVDAALNEELEILLSDVTEFHSILEATLTLEAELNDEFSPKVALKEFMSTLEDSTNWRYLSGPEVSEAD